MYRSIASGIAMAIFLALLFIWGTATAQADKSTTKPKTYPLPAGWKQLNLDGPTKAKIHLVQEKWHKTIKELEMKIQEAKATEKAEMIACLPDAAKAQLAKGLGIEPKVEPKTDTPKKE